MSRVAAFELGGPDPNAWGVLVGYLVAMGVTWTNAVVLAAAERMAIPTATPPVPLSPLEVLSRMIRTQLA